MTQHKDSLLEVRNLRKEFALKKEGGAKRSLLAVERVSFDIAAGEVLALVGESGSGKSTIGKMVLRLLPATEGQVRFQGKSVFEASEKELKCMRGKMQIVFQDPFSSLNPNMRVGETLSEVLSIHFPDMSREERAFRTVELLAQVGLRAEHVGRYPHQFSGGQRQRIAIARAIAVKPRLIVADEPVSALDVSVRAQILNLMQKLQRDLGLAMLFISHDLGVVRHVADRVMVLYLGRVMEIGTTTELFERPKHPYTRALLSAAPSLNPDAQRNRIVLQGDLPSPISPPSGCVFRTRCPYAQDRCAQHVPQLADLGGGQQAACLRIGELDFN
ncbi:dipeptide ABC transporter ATP-binding protein [soil metagenome]